MSGDRAGGNTEIIVSNANPDLSQSWTTQSDRRGKWQLSVNAPQPVPCRVVASDGSNQDEMDVSGAPADCDGTVVVNTPPTAGDDSAETDADQSVVIDLLANDTDPDGSLDPASLQILSGPSNGSLTDLGNGSVSYTPNSGFSGSDSFSYQVSDNLGAASNAANVSITVNPVIVNSPPTAQDDSAETDADLSVEIDLLANDSDSDGSLDPASLQILSGPSNGSLTDLGNGSVRYTPNGGFSGSDSFSYQVSDNLGAASNEANVSITINPVTVNVPPTAQDDSAATDAGQSVVIDLLANDSDSDGSLDLTSVQFLSTPLSGILTDLGSGSVRYTPDSGFSGDDGFSYQVSDDQGAVSNTAQVSITVNPLTPPPSGDPVSINSTSGNTLFPASPVSERPMAANTEYKVLASNDLGMHCADLDYQIFSILPPFNVVHAQVVRRGVGNSRPQLMDDSNIDLFYSATSSSIDPALAKDPVSPVFKSNFWSDPDNDGRTFGYDTYAPLFFGLLLPTDIDTQDMGLPVPDSHLLRACLAGYLGGTADASTTRDACAMVQQSMPGIFTPFSDNQPQKFNRFDTHINFFNELLGGVGLGGLVHDVNWFAADGVPIMPVDDQGRSNAYPLVRVEAIERSSQDQLASTDIVLPVASEADCQTCHATAIDCASINISPGFECDGTALTRTSDWKIMSIDGDEDNILPPGETDLQRLLNTAKINILRLHDRKHGTDLDASRPVQCATCHYTPALDLAQLGPMSAGEVDQTGHITMSRAMHGHHGELAADPSRPFDPVTNNLFPDMPAANDPLRQARAIDHYADASDPYQTVTEYVLNKTCYSCHPGKRTQCLRGAMAAGGVVCQDCHGQARHVGNDFSENLASTPWPDGANLTKRVPWAVEPGCQSCHTGDAVNPNHPAGSLVAHDGIRLLQAYQLTPGTDASGTPDGTELAVPIEAPASRFAENENLYRISKGHGGLMCQACHGSTHAIFPNPLGAANDNVASNQLQGHAGTIIECDTCHDPQAFEDSGALELTTNGPHGMHAVGSFRWNKSHKEARTGGGTNCQACHGTSGDGTVLSRIATDRMLWCKDEKGLMCDSEGWGLFPAGHQVGCADCHAKMR
ncbi:MAG: cadherin-like domain-containing protein [Candidatus Thiodiazotropha sp.]